MKKLAALMLNFFLLAIPSLVWAAGAGKPPPDMAARQVKMAGLSAINAFFAGWYNDNKMVFAIIVTVVMGAVGGLLALITDIILKLIGMDVSKIEHHE